MTLIKDLYVCKTSLNISHVRSVVESFAGKEVVSINRLD